MLNREEKILCGLNPYECGAVIGRGREASQWARSKTPELGDAEADNKRDALRHGSWQALLSKQIGEGRAEVWKNAHETSSTSPGSTCMDLENNRIGREVGRTWNNVYDGIDRAWNDGLMIGSPC